LIRRTGIDGVLVLERESLADDRGFFRETFRLGELEQAVGRPVGFVQQNHARSRRDVLRGLHAETWDKLIYVPHGRVFNAVADIRPDSPTFGKVACFELGGDDSLALFLPTGVANGYCVLTDEADYLYLVTRYYDGSDTRGVMWDDPDLAVPWPVRAPILSKRDRENPTLRQLVPERFAGD
jgi:dTDP-4-dehydrorhamnose 3,5-epimerase